MSEPSYVPNYLLQASKLPPPDAAPEAVLRFASTFDGYKHAGSFEACAAIAQTRRHDTLSDLRTCLFFEMRSWRHAGYLPDEEAMRYMRSLIEQIRQRVQAANDLLR